MLYYPYKMMLSAYKSVTPCDCHLFISKVTKIAWYIGVHFWLVLTIKTTWSLVAEIMCVLNIYSSIHIFNIKFQRKTVYNILLFLTEVHNLLQNQIKTYTVQMTHMDAHTQQLTVHPLSFTVLWSVLLCVAIFFCCTLAWLSLLSENLEKIVFFSSMHQMTEVLASYVGRY